MLLTSFSDIFKNSFLENMTAVSFVDYGIALSASFILGMFIYMIYKRTFLGVMYSESFNLSLILLTLLTTFVILAVTSNVVLSLGMVGALSIVRFRTAIKDPLDLVFLFWAIGGGIVMGAGLIPLGIFGSMFIGLLLVFKGKQTGENAAYIAIVRLDNASAEEEAYRILESRTKKLRIKSKTQSAYEHELIYECQLKDQDTAFVNAIAEIKGVSNIQLVSYNGDYAG